jgi:hypothetical protein
MKTRIKQIQKLLFNLFNSLIDTDLKGKFSLEYGSKPGTTIIMTFSEEKEYIKGEAFRDCLGRYILEHSSGKIYKAGYEIEAVDMFVEIRQDLGIPVDRSIIERKLSNPYSRETLEEMTTEERLDTLEALKGAMEVDVYDGKLKNCLYRELEGVVFEIEQEIRY